MRDMVGGNAITAYHLDRTKLEQIARDIDAPTAAEIATPIDSRKRLVPASPPHRRASHDFLNEAWYVGRQPSDWAMLGCVQM